MRNANIKTGVKEPGFQRKKKLKYLNKNYYNNIYPIQSVQRIK